MHGRGRRATWRAADGSPRVRRLVWCEGALQPALAHATPRIRDGDGDGDEQGHGGAWNAAVKPEFLRVLYLRRDVRTLVDGLVF